MAKFATNASGAVLLPNSVQVTESISGSVVPLAMFLTNFLISLLIPHLFPQETCIGREIWKVSWYLARAKANPSMSAEESINAIH